MNLVEAILKEHSVVMRDRIVKYVGNDTTRFKELVRVFLKGPYLMTQRASWPLAYCVEKYPELIKPHLSRILKNLETPGIPVAVKRNTVRLLQFVEIPKPFQGSAANICFKFLSDPREPIAARVFSMTVLANIAKDHPEIGNELRIIIEDQLPFGPAGFVSRGKKVLKALKV